jgi:hypothetical protein
MIRHRSCGVPTADALRDLGAFGGSLLSLSGQRREPPAFRTDNQRRAQVAREFRLALVESELTEVVVHVGDGPGRGQLAFVCGGALLSLGCFSRRVELLRHILGPLKRGVRGVGPESLDVRLPVGRARGRVGFRRLARSRSGGRRLCCDRDQGQRHDAERQTDPREQWTSHRKSPGQPGLATSRFAYHTRTEYRLRAVNVVFAAVQPR